MSRIRIIPGNRANLRQVLSIYAQERLYCNCIKEQYKKADDATVDPNISTTMRRSNLIQNNYTGGQTVFANAPTARVRLIGALGTTEGQPGGMGMPIRNRLR